MGIANKPSEESFMQKRRKRRRNRRKHNLQDISDLVYKQAEEGSLLSSIHANYVSTMSLYDERNSEAGFLPDAGETKVVSLAISDQENASSEPLPSLSIRTKRGRNRRKHNLQDISNPAHKQVQQERGLPSTIHVNNVSTISLSNERNSEAGFLPGAGETKLVSLAISDKENASAKALPSLPIRRKRGRNRRKQNLQDISNPAHKQGEEGCLPSTIHENNVSTISLSDERNSEAGFLPDAGETKLVSLATGDKETASLEPLPSLPMRRKRARNRRKHNLQDITNPACEQRKEGGLPSTNHGNNVSTISLSDERSSEAGFLSDAGENKLVFLGSTDKENASSEPLPSLPIRRKRRRNRKKHNLQDISYPAHKEAEESGLLSTNHANHVSTITLSDEGDNEASFLPDAGETRLSLAISDKENASPEPLPSLLIRASISHLGKKLLILDLNGLLVDIVSNPPKGCKADIKIAKQAIFKRPFCLDFLKFCFERFEVAVWSSRTKKKIDRVIDFLMGDMKLKLLFCWDLSHCTATRFRTIENKHKALVFKELRRIWEKQDPQLPWEKGYYNESNTLLLDDSPYKALLNPVHTAIFPYSYHFKARNDKSLGPGGDLRVYLEGLAVANNVQKFVEHHPFGQTAITERSASWGFYLQVISSLNPFPTVR